MNILELPKEILLEIWSYLSEFEDVFRFGHTCKRIETTLYRCRKSISLSVAHPPEVWQDVLSRADRQQLHQLNLVHPVQPKNEYVFEVPDTLTVLSTLRSLRCLHVHFYEVNGRSPSGMKKLLDLSQIFHKMTWLEYLYIGMPLQNDIGELFEDYAKLTALTIGSKTKGIGYAKLTQLKALGLSIYADDDVLKQVLDLTQLTSLDISWSDISQENAMCISKLTNLETIQLAGVHFSDRKFLGSLPKLHALQDALEDDEYTMLSSLTMLTSLDITFSQNIPMRIITTLAELKHLDIDGNFGDSPNFSALSKLKTLRIISTQEIAHIQLPHGIKNLTLSKFFKESIFEDICNVDSIEQLFVDFDLLNPPSAIGRLTNLRSLQFSKEMPKDLCRHLTSLCTLRTIAFSVISDHIVNEIQVLTQLCSLQFSDYYHSTMTLQEIRRRLPFIVYKRQLVQ